MRTCIVLVVSSEDLCASDPHNGIVRTHADSQMAVFWLGAVKIHMGPLGPVRILSGVHEDSSGMGSGAIAVTRAGLAMPAGHATGVPGWYGKPI